MGRYLAAQDILNTEVAVPARACKDLAVRPMAMTCSRRNSRFWSENTKRIQGHQEKLDLQSRIAPIIPAELVDVSAPSYIGQNIQWFFQTARELHRRLPVDIEFGVGPTQPFQISGNISHRSIFSALRISISSPKLIL